MLLVILSHREYFLLWGYKFKEGWCCTIRDWILDKNIGFWVNDDFSTYLGTDLFQDYTKANIELKKRASDVSQPINDSDLESQLKEWLDCDSGCHDCWPEHEQFLQRLNVDNIQHELEPNKTFVTYLESDVRDTLFGAENEYEI